MTSVSEGNLSCFRAVDYQNLHIFSARRVVSNSRTIGSNIRRIPYNVSSHSSHSSLTRSRHVADNL